MDTKNFIQTSMARTQMLKCRKKEDERRKREADRKLRDRRCFIVGGLVCKYFPEINQLRPRQTKAENDAEFAEFEGILSLLANEPDLVVLLKNESKKYPK